MNRQGCTLDTISQLNEFTSQSHLATMPTSSPCPAPQWCACKERSCTHAGTSRSVDTSLILLCTLSINTSLTCTAQSRHSCVTTLVLRTVVQDRSSWFVRQLAQSIHYESKRANRAARHNNDRHTAELHAVGTLKKIQQIFVFYTEFET